MLKGTAFLLAVLVGWLSSYWIGAWPWLGYAWLDRSSFGAGPVTIIGEDSMGTTLGFENFVFFEGQEVIIDYDVDIRAGSLWFHVFEPFDGTLGDGVSHYVTESGKGTWTMPVRKTAYYHVTIDPSPVKGPGKGWDLTYTVKWGARPGGRR
ncbi:MAG: hypothetical protein ABR538_15085 [Candidatus Binatia bacterium]